jgi:hypothetical protein
MRPYGFGRAAKSVGWVCLSVCLSICLVLLASSRAAGQKRLDEHGAALGSEVSENPGIGRDEAA